MIYIKFHNIIILKSKNKADRTVLYSKTPVCNSIIRLITYENYENSILYIYIISQ